MLWFDTVGRMRMERIECNGKWQLWPLHAHTTHHVKSQHSSTLYMVILRLIRVILWRYSTEKLRSTGDISGSWRYLDFVGEFADHYKVACAQCHTR